MIAGMTPAAYFAFLGLMPKLVVLGHAFSALEGSVEKTLPAALLGVEEGLGRVKVDAPGWR